MLSRYILILCGLTTSLILSSCNSQKQPAVQDVSQTVILTPVPTAKETIMVPVGYTTCYTVKAGFYKHTWVPAHRVCQYTNAVDASKTVWVDGYWMCTRYDLGKSECGFWVWKKAHWSSYSVLY